MHGYQLRAELEATTGGVWPLNVGQVYTTVARPERDGLVTTDDAPDQADGKVIYRLTERGRDELRAWFGTPLERGSRPRDELAIKLALALTTPGVNVREVVRAQHGHAAHAAGADPPRCAHRRERRCGLAARERVDGLPGGCGGPLARSVRGTARRAPTGPPSQLFGREPQRGAPLSEHVLELQTCPASTDVVPRPCMRCAMSVSGCMRGSSSRSWVRRARASRRC
jgi:DNA-binding PadR family transcriptional regulator